jgi:hypothetical protein
MNAFPYPMGHRLRSGEIQFGESDRVMLRLVRAELNVIVMEARDLEVEINEGTWRGWWIKIRGLAPSTKPSVNFEDLMNTLVYWRKPDLVPEIRKLVRSERIKKVRPRQSPAILPPSHTVRPLYMYAIFFASFSLSLTLNPKP